MSKIIKSGQCVETHPRQLQTVDVDSFFISNEETDQKDLTMESSLSDLEEETVATREQESSSEDQITEKSTLEQEEEQVASEQDENEETAAKDTVVTISTADRKRLESALLGFEDQPNKPKFKVRQEESPLDSILAKQEVAAGSDSEAVNLERIANVAETIESLFSGAKKQTGPISESAKQPADEIASSEEHKAGSFIGQSGKQAETIISMAKSQSDLIIVGASQQAEKTIEKAKHQAGVILENAKKEAATIVDDVQKQTETMLEEAKLQSVGIKEQAHQDGLISGRQEAVNVIRKELADNLTQALSLINEIESERMQRLTSSEPELIKLAVAIAEKIIGEELGIDTLRQLQIVREALSRVATANTVIIRIHSDDLQSVNENLTLLQSSFSEPKPIKVVEDCSIAKGSCFIETDNGNLDARIKSQLNLIMTELLKVGRIE